MHHFTFDLPLIASITITSDSPETAAETLQAALANTKARFGELYGECSLMEDVDLWRHLGMVDGVDCVNQFGKMRNANA